MQPLNSGDPRRIGPYALRGRLGEGAQGQVYLGVRDDGTNAAVKVLNSELLGDARARGRFEREIQTARRVAQFCTAQVLDFDVNHDPPFVAGEYVPGPTLHETLARQGPLAGAALERLAVNTATALAAIHQTGVVHLDFKPGNVLMGPDGPRVIDFGIARALDHGGTATSTVMGTPAFMAPEQFMDAQVGSPADLFAWAGTMAWAATGRAPFGLDQPSAIMYRVLHEAPDVGALEGGRLGDLVRACLARDPARRPSARAALDHLIGAGPLPVPSGLEPSGPVRSGPAPSGSVPSGPTPSGSVPSGSVRSGSVPSGSVRSGSVPSGPVRSGSVPSGPVRSGPAPSGSVRSGSVPSGSVRSGSVPSGSVRSGPAPSGPVGDGHAEPQGSVTRGALTRGAETRGAETRGAETRGAETQPRPPKRKWPIVMFSILALLVIGGVMGLLAFVNANEPPPSEPAARVRAVENTTVRKDDPCALLTEDTAFTYNLHTDNGVASGTPTSSTCKLSSGFSDASAELTMTAHEGSGAYDEIRGNAERNPSGDASSATRFSTVTDVTGIGQAGFQQIKTVTDGGGTVTKVAQLVVRDGNRVINVVYQADDNTVSGGDVTDQAVSRAATAIAKEATANAAKAS